MKKPMFALILGILLVCGFSTTAVAQTHKVVAEYGTATWCGYCKYAHEALIQLDAAGNLPFYYVSHVTDKNSKAYNRCKQDFNVKGYPTVWFDGGYKLNVGAGSTSSAKNAYTNSINQCKNATVADIDVDVMVFWKNTATMDIVVSVKNNEASVYKGKLKTFVVEKKSSLNWKDTAGKLYTNAFLDYAQNMDITVQPGQTFTNINTWVGASHGYGGIQANNIKVIAAVFNSVGQTKYSYPPNSNPFTAHFCDDADAAVPVVLESNTLTIKETGGSANFSLVGDKDNANRNYIIFGSITGSTPGTPLPGGHVTAPFNWDIFTNVLLQLSGSSIFPGFMGTLDINGEASASINLPNVSGNSGLAMTFCFCCDDMVWDVASNPVTITIVP